MRGGYGSAEREALSSSLVGLKPSLNQPPKSLQTTHYPPQAGCSSGAHAPSPHPASPGGWDGLMDKEKIPPKKSGLMEDRTASPLGNIMFAFSGGVIGGGTTPGAASPHSGRLGGLWEVWRVLRDEGTRSATRGAKIADLRPVPGEWRSHLTGEDGNRNPP